MEKHRRKAEAIEEQFNIGYQTLAKKDHHRLWKPKNEVLALDPEIQEKWLKSVIAARRQFEASQKVRDEAPNQAVTEMRIRLTN